MKNFSLKEIKNELEQNSKEKLLSYCIRLIKLRKENKELIAYLLFGSNDATAYLQEIKEEITAMFSEMQKSHVYYIKKSTRKIVRFINKQAKFIHEKNLEAEMRIHFCNCFHVYSIPFKKSRQLLNLYEQQVKKINELLAGVHEDMQYDLKKMFLF